MLTNIDIWKWLEEFFLISLPEQFLMLLFIWIILGRKETVKFGKMIIAGLSTAVFYFPIQHVLHGNPPLVAVPQFIFIVLIVYFLYKLSALEALVGCLITFVVYATLQTTLINVLGVLTLGTSNIKETTEFVYFFSVVYYSVSLLLNYIVYKSGINLHYLKLNELSKLDKSQKQRIRFLILNLVFALFFIIINFTIYYRNFDIFQTSTEKMLLLLSVVFSVVFSFYLIRSMFSIGEIIKKEEALKRQQDGREIIQNIDYLYTLIENKEYDELKNALKSIESDIDNGIVNNNYGSKP